MWLLKHQETGDCFVLTQDKPKFIVGRISADLVLDNDTSVSRTHACLHSQESQAGGELVIELEDPGSKYGTFRNDDIAKNVRLPKGKRVVLNDGDRIRFGILQNVWEVSQRPISIISSALSPTEAQQLGQHVRVLGGKCLNSWSSDSTHLTMTEVTLTVKVLHALLEQIPIVTCEYWRDLVKMARRGRSSLPRPESYIPQRCGSSLQNQVVDLKSHPERKTIFAGMTFLFLNRKQFDLYLPIVNKAGGSCKDFNSGIKKALMVKKNVVVIQYVSSSQSQSSQTINSIEAYLESHSLRIIPEYEIGLAILYCSTEKYCNPSYNVMEDLLPCSAAETEKFPANNSLLIENTRPNNKNCKGTFSELSDMIIPETEHRSMRSHDTGTASTASGLNDVIVESDVIGVEELEMPMLRVTESYDITHNKRKRAARGNPITETNDIMDDDDDDDSNLFNYAKRTHLDSAEKKKNTKNSNKSSPEVVEKEHKSTSTKAKNTPKASPRPLPIIMNAKRSSVMNTKGFLQKTSPNKIAKDCKTDEEEPETRKRPLIAVIGDDDDDVFNFGNSKVARTSNDGKTSTNVDDDLFAFNDQRSNDSEQMQTANGNNMENIDLESTQEFVPKKDAQQSNSNFVLPKPKPLPRKISFTINKMIKKEEDIKKDMTGDATKGDTEDIIEENDDKDKQQWIHSLVKGVNVRVFVPNVTAMNSALASTLNGSHNDVTDAANDTKSKGKNFKTFSKKFNAQLHQKNIQTTAISIGQLRLR